MHVENKMYLKNQDALFVEHLLCLGALCVPHSIFPVLWGRNSCPLSPGRWSRDPTASRWITLGHSSSPPWKPPSQTMRVLKTQAGSLQAAHDPRHHCPWCALSRSFRSHRAGGFQCEGSFLVASWAPHPCPRGPPAGQGWGTGPHKQDPLPDRGPSSHRTLSVFQLEALLLPASCGRPAVPTTVFTSQRPLLVFSQLSKKDLRPFCRSISQTNSRSNLNM